jgi:DNA-directed RNA polymerase specialized sigma24 family protein
MNSPDNNSGGSLSALITSQLLSDARNGDPAALEQFCLALHAELTGIARAVQRLKGGSPDGVNGVSDLAQSVAANIFAKPDQELAMVVTVRDLRGRLFQLLTEKWIDRRRKATRQKRGGGNVIAASQLEHEEEASLLARFAAPTVDETRDDIDAMLSVFEPGSERQRILLLTLMGQTQEEIGGLLGLSRDAVGRRVRNGIEKPLKKKFAAGEND